MTDAELGARSTRSSSGSTSTLGRCWPACRARAIHDDLNDYNVLVAGSVASADGARVTGIVDFGDMVHSYRVADLAIAGAYIDARRR